MEGIIGYVTMFAGNFAPKSWAFCNGQTINIASNTALFSILGTTYGGNGTTNFQLPNTQGRTVAGAGNGPGLSPYALGQAAGNNSVTLSLAQMPAHIHPVMVTAQNLGQENSQASLSAANGNVYATDPTLFPYDTNAAAAGGTFQATLTMSNVGSNMPVNLQRPMIGMNYIICQYGVFPQRN
ncbi:MAG: phage tail protein [Bacteroidia bacterium]